MSKICVVGSADSLVGKELGELIDSHDIIVRINQPKISGFENDVGSRLTHSFISAWQIAGWTSKKNVCGHCKSRIENIGTRDRSIINEDCFERLKIESEATIVLPNPCLFFGLNYNFHAFYRDISPFISDNIQIQFIEVA